MRDKELLSNHVFSNGKIIKVDFGSNNGGGIMYKIEGVYSDKLAFDNVGGSKCESHIYSLLKEVKKFNFPVVYNPRDLSNSEILIFKDQYLKYNFAIPNELIEIVDAISICQK